MSVYGFFFKKNLFFKVTKHEIALTHLINFPFFFIFLMLCMRSTSIKVFFFSIICSPIRNERCTHIGTFFFSSRTQLMYQGTLFHEKGLVVLQS